MRLNRRSEQEAPLKSEVLQSFAVMGFHLESFSDFAGPMAVVQEKRSEGFELSYVSTRPSLVMPRCASALEVHVAGARLAADAFGFVLVPAGTETTLKPNTSVCDVALFFPSAELFAATAADHGIESPESHFERARHIRRNNWLNEVMHRYLFERCVLHRNGSEGARFLEREILKEVHFRCTESRRAERFDLDEKVHDGRGPATRKAMAYIESHLFDELSIPLIARKAGVSESTLLRTFSREVGKSPSAYITERRLDEAALLLRSRRYSVSEVADLVGYESVSGFGAAFRKKFGVSPTEWTG